MNAMEKRGVSLLTLIALLAAGAAHAAGADLGQSAKQATNWTAIIMFGVFVAGTLWITKWAAAKTKSASDFYTAGGGITGFQNGLAIAGDYMSAASFLGISAAVMASGYDGLIYSIGFLVGWPIITFLMAERLRNLGKFTFADVAGYRFKQAPIRAFAASGTLVVVAFYLIAQMVGAGKLIELLFGLDYHVAVILVGILMVCYVLFGGMLATTWVQIIKAVLLLSGASFMALMVMKHVNFDFGTLFSEAVKAHPKGEAIMSPGGLVKDPISAISLGLALMFGTAGRQGADLGLLEAERGDVGEGVLAEVAQAFSDQEQDDRPADQEADRVDQAVVAGSEHQGGNTQEGGRRHIVTGDRQTVLEAGDATAGGVEVGRRLAALGGPVGDAQGEADERHEHDDGGDVQRLTLHFAFDGTGRPEGRRQRQQAECGEDTRDHFCTSARISWFRRSNSLLARLT